MPAFRDFMRLVRTYRNPLLANNGGNWGRTQALMGDMNGLLFVRGVNDGQQANRTIGIPGGMGWANPASGGTGLISGLILMRAIVFAGTAGTAWSANPIYFQLFEQSTVPTLGAVPKITIPVAPPPSFLAIDLANSQLGLSSNSSAWGFSSTAATFTGGPTGTVNALVANIEDRALF